MTDSANLRAGGDAPGACENCTAPLHGAFCHQCGQSIHNPIRHAGHAVEEFFEAFWHLDGRVWRTLRDLLSPGRVAINYLDGHRQRYIAPLRLFVVLSLLTFFLGAASVHVDETSVIDVNSSVARLEAATTVAEVERLRDELSAQLDAARTASSDAPGVDTALIAAEVRIRGAAANRVVELTGASPAADADPGGDGDAPGSAAEGERLTFNILGHSGPWHSQTNPLVIGWWPDFANDWLNRRIGNVERNMQTDRFASAEFWVQGLMAAAPTALFLLVPVFALLLKIVYLFTRRLYLEHLVVALYSHAFLLLALTALFVLSLLGSWLTSGAVWIGLVIATAWSAMVVWMAVYLLLMQKRVYRQGWWLTSLKYVFVGNIYFGMLLVATILMFLARLSDG